MDKTMDSGSINAGSIPARDAIRTKAFQVLYPEGFCSTNIFYIFVTSRIFDVQ